MNRRHRAGFETARSDCRRHRPDVLAKIVQTSDDPDWSRGYYEALVLHGIDEDLRAEVPGLVLVDSLRRWAKGESETTLFDFAAVEDALHWLAEDAASRSAAIERLYATALGITRSPAVFVVEAVVCS